MPTVSQISSPAATGLGIALPLMGVNPVIGGVVAGAAGLVGLIDQIGQGRKTANKMTQNGGPQDILNKQLAAISNSDASGEEKSQATDLAWRGFLQAANQFAATQGPRAAQVVQQAIYKTPELTNTVKALLGKDPLDASYTSQATVQAGSKVNTGGVPWGQIALTAGAAAAPFAINAFTGGPRSLSPDESAFLGGGPDTSNLTSIAGVNNPGPNPGSWTLDTEGNPVWSGPTGAQGNPAPGGGGGAGGAITSPSGSGGTNSWGGLFQRLFPTLLSAGTSLVTGALGYNAAKSAAGVQSDASLKAAQIIAASGKYSTDAMSAGLDKTLAFNKDVLNQQQQNIQPWINAGSGALQKISDITNAPGFNWTQTFKAPTAEEAMQDPGIQFQLTEGQKAIEQFERAHGKLLTGGAIKDINQFAQGVASTGYQNVFNRALQGYGTNYNTFAQERAATLNPQFSLAGLGQTSAATLNTDLSSAANLNTGAQLGTAQTIAGINQATAQGVAANQTSAAAARASGYVGGASAITGAVGQIGNNLLQTQTIQQILAALGRQPANA